MSMLTFTADNCHGEPVTLHFDLALEGPLFLETAADDGTRSLWPLDIDGPWLRRFIAHWLHRSATDDDLRAMWEKLGPDEVIACSQRGWQQMLPPPTD